MKFNNEVMMELADRLNTLQEEHGVGEVLEQWGVENANSEEFCEAFLLTEVDLARVAAGALFSGPEDFLSTMAAMKMSAFALGMMFQKELDKEKKARKSKQ